MLALLSVEGTGVQGLGVWWYERTVSLSLDPTRGLGAHRTELANGLWQDDLATHALAH